MYHCTIFLSNVLAPVPLPSVVEPSNYLHSAIWSHCESGLPFCPGHDRGTHIRHDLEPVISNRAYKTAHICPSFKLSIIISSLVIFPSLFVKTLISRNGQLRCYSGSCQPGLCRYHAGSWRAVRSSRRSELCRCRCPCPR